MNSSLLNNLLSLPLSEINNLSKKGLINFIHILINEFDFTVKKPKEEEANE